MRRKHLLKDTSNYKYVESSTDERIDDYDADSERDEANEHP